MHSSACKVAELCIHVVYAHLQFVSWKHKAINSVNIAAAVGLSRKVDFDKCEAFVYNLVKIISFLECEVVKETSLQL